MHEFDLTVTKYNENISLENHYGDSFTPEFVYTALRSNKLFANMRRGHQEDAEEFLGFLLDGLHEEFVLAAKRWQEAGVQTSASISDNMNNYNDLAAIMIDMQDSSETIQEDGWLEVGKKNRVAVTRTVCLFLNRDDTR